MKCQRILKNGIKHCGKRRNCSLRAISPFDNYGYRKCGPVFAQYFSELSQF